tara:strand:- start:850 stop:1074 length:225 start_codon:yes stop_codon:yes gene_type:complete
MVDDLEILIDSVWITEGDKRKKVKHQEHRERVGSVKIDFYTSFEALQKLTTVLEEEVFEHDAVELTVTYKSRSY